MSQENLQRNILKFHLFELSNYSCKIFCKSAQDFDGVVLSKVALGRQVSKSELYYENEGSWLASFSGRRLDYFGIDFKHFEAIKIEAFDNYSLSHNIFIKT